MTFRQQLSTRSAKFLNSSSYMSEYPEHENLIIPLKRFKSILKNFKPSASEAKDLEEKISIEYQNIVVHD